ncbi:arabinosyltransferase domain-containing protein [Staphylococcus chromogenes]|nr:arabinosyltransferase domain-containing protein [Staphylococcus chromogenes]
MSIAAKRTPNWIKSLAIVSGLLGFLCFLLTPFLPVNQTQSSFDWPQKGVNSVNAPLMSYVPESVSATVPVSVLDSMPEKEWMVLGTLPADSKDATTRGLFVRYTKTGLDVIVRDKVPLSIPKSDLPKDAQLKVFANAERTELTFGNKTQVLEGDHRPQLTGIYTDLPRDAQPQGINAHVEINSRFTSSPSVIKYIVMWLGLISTFVALWALHQLDKLDGRKSRRFFPKDWWKLRPLDLVVGGTLLLWHFIGANTADDGYLLTMARISRSSDYMANYYRWFGVPESPFGAPYYDLLALMTYVSTSSIWMRLPALLAGWCVWLLISREVLPRLGAKITGRRVAHWTAAITFLAFWIVYNNGTRPEPVIALGALMTWVCMERAIATSRLLPAAVGVIVATLALGAGPTGLMAVAALLAALSSLIRIIYRRIKLIGGPTWLAILAMVAPFLASGTAILLGVFGDQTPASVMEAIRVRADKGPALPWYMEWVRYESLLGQTVDGSFARRFAVFMVLTSVALVLASMLRNGRVPGSAAGPAMRLLLAFLGTLFFMMFTPTKWTHHFGVWAGIGAALAGLAAVALSHMALKSARSRTLLFGGILFVLAFCLSGTNGWWYVSSFGVPWYDKTVQFKAIEASTVMLFIALLVLVTGTIQSFISDVKTARAESQGNLAELERENRRKLARFAGLAASPIAVVSAVVVMFSFLSLGKGFVSQYPAYSVGLGNFRSAVGDTCALANDAMLETNSNDSFLSPADGTELGKSLDANAPRGFDANNVPESIAVEGPAKTHSQSSQGSISGATASEDTTETGGGQATGNTGGVRAETGVNGSKAFLPFELDYRKIPVLGSYTEGPQFPAEVTTTWYGLPARSEDTPILVVSAAGKIAHHDINGVKQDGQELVIEYGTRAADGSVTNTGKLEPLDIGPAPSWRNLRVPLDRIPETANVVRIVAKDQNLDPNQWLAFVPPRVPKLDSLNNVIGSDQAGLLDWAVALQFPCQRTFNHYAGVAEMAQFRISPDHPGKVTLSPVMDYAGGGVLGVTEAVNTSVEIPGYLKNDWQRDWGSISRYYPRTNSRGEAPDVAVIHHEQVQRSGLWSNGPMKTDE